ncbi:AAA family ATPase [Streptomyces sp. NPDC002120]|uniref:AAA family ATPase n=1 Tax=Streptomyces sp. NPDC002120 TaxID=3364631 RepID=UPI0036BD2750
MLGIAVGDYASPRFPTLPQATEQTRDLCTLLEGQGFDPTVAADPSLRTLRATVARWSEGWRTSGAHGPAVIVWSGHGVSENRDLRLIVQDTDQPGNREETYPAKALADAALRSGADQVLIVIDACHAGSAITEVLQTASNKLSSLTLPPGRASWLGVVASGHSSQRAPCSGTLLEVVTRVLREGPSAPEYHHEWSRRNGQVTGAAVMRAVLAQWSHDSGQRPVVASIGEDRPMFGNPLRRIATGPELAEHLVRAAQGADQVDEGWFFSGRRQVLGEITEWLENRRSGLFLVTGGPGSGKSAVLGRIATLSDPVHRAGILAHHALGPGDPDPGAGAVDVALHLRGFTVQQLAEAIADGLTLSPPPTPAALISDVERHWPDHGRRLVLILDGLDEVAPGQALPMIEQLLAPLSRLACVLLGSRDRPFRPRAEPAEPLDHTLSRLLDTRAHVTSLDDDFNTESDIQEYSRRRLYGEGLSTEVAERAARLIAEQASTSSGGGFLFARMAISSLTRRLAASGTESWESAIPATVGADLTSDLEEGPKRERDGGLLRWAADDLLTALAWSTGNGMPARGVWEAAATALSMDGTEYRAEDLDWLLNTYGRYVVEDSDGTQAVYRLYHGAFIEHLRGRIRHAAHGNDPAYSVARGLVDLLRRQTADATMVESANPYLRRSLSEHAVMAGGRGISLVRELVDLREELFLPDLARALGEAAVSLSLAGQRDEGIGPAQEATDIYRALAEDNPAGYLPDLAMSLNNLSVLQAETGDRQGALTTVSEAVTIRRTLAQNNPAAYLPHLAASLNNLANHQGETGDRNGALTTIVEATGLYRGLAEDNPAAYLPDLAMSLNNLANHQAETGDRNGALTTIVEATGLYRGLAEDNPAAHLPDLAMSLNNLSVLQAETGDRQGALTTSTEAVTIRRSLAQNNPAAHLPDLAASLNNLATHQGETGDRQGALTAVSEATDLYRTLAQANPAAYLPHLAASLNNLANHQGMFGSRHSGLAISTEATDLYRTLTEDNPAAYLPHLAASLNNLANHQAETGDLDGALTTSTEATDLYRALTGDNPAAHLPDLAASLNNLANRQAETGDLDGALTTSTEAVTIRRSLAQDNPTAHLPHLAASLNNLANHQAKTGDRQGALTTIAEATDLYRTLAQANPAAYLPHLAASLNNLADMAPGQQTLTAYAEAMRSLSAHPQASRFLAVQHAKTQLDHSDSERGIRSLITLAKSPQVSGTYDPAAVLARQLLRVHGRRDASRTTQVVSLWREETRAEAPGWLALPQAALDLAGEWINQPTWAASRTFWDEHEDRLRSAETAAALEELALADETAATHLQISRVAAASDPDRAFRPYLTSELLDTWIALPTWEASRRYLAEHADMLLHEQALELLGSDLDTPETAVNFAVIVLSRADGIPAAYRCVQSRAALHHRLQQLLADPKPEPALFHAAALLELFVYQEDFTGAAHLALASAMDGSPRPYAWWPPAEPADRDRVISEIASLRGRRREYGPALDALTESILAASTPAHA